jgi:hypothetical protein
LLETEVRTTSYDSVTELYRNQLESGLKLIGEIKPSPEFTIRVGPQLSNCRSLPLPQSEDYRETALILGLEYLKPGKLMISFEDRPGRRTYPWADTTDPTNYLSNQSDYFFNELDLSLNWTIISTAAGALSLNGLASLAPEWHTTQADNLSFNTYTLELKYSF